MHRSRTSFVHRALRVARLVGPLCGLLACKREVDPGPPLTEVTGVSAVLSDVARDPNVVEVNLVARKQSLMLGPGLSFEMLTYDGLFPGPLLQAKVGDRVIVHFTNHIGAPTTIHWHGVRVPDFMDGSPMVRAPIPDGGSFTYDFVVPEAATFWFHPHVDTAYQLNHGLYAPFVVHSPLDPVYDEERMIMLDDLAVDASGALLPELGTYTDQVLGQLGNVLLTNGRPSELAVVESAEGRVERWRILDAANARTMQLRLTGPAHFRVIATDGGLLPTPYTTSTLTISPGQRYDLEVSYDGPGTVQLESNVTLNEVDGGVFQGWKPVFVANAVATGMPPRTIGWPDVPPIEERTPNRNAAIDFSVASDGDGGVLWMINGSAMHTTPLYGFELGDTVDLTLTNYSSVPHPFHLHGQFFTLMDGGTPETQLPGLRDTVLVPAGLSMHVAGRMDNPGRWMMHCHILEHAELGMMAEITVGDAGIP